MYYLGHMGFLGGLGMILFWAVFALLVFWLVNLTREPRKDFASKKVEDPLQVLKLRLARGDISKEKYKALKAELMK